MANEEQNVNEVEEVVEQKSFNILRFLEDNSRNLLAAGVVLILVAAGIYYYTNVMVPNKEKEAANELFKAEAYYLTDSLDQALNGDGEFLGLIEVAEQYGSTKSGERAQYLAGSVLMRQGKYEDALEYLESVSFDDEIVAPLSVCLQGDCMVELDRIEEGASLYMKAANMRDNKFTAPYCLSKAARAYSAIEDWDNALKAYERINEDYKETQYAAEIEKYIARVKAAKG
jgi:tetratricopeptide (TPR) repeat protein